MIWDEFLLIVLENKALTDTMDQYDYMHILEQNFPDNAEHMRLGSSYRFEQD